MSKTKRKKFYHDDTKARPKAGNETKQKSFCKGYPKNKAIDEETDDCAEAIDDLSDPGRGTDGDGG